MRALAASPESDDDTFILFFFLGNDRYQRKPGDVALTFGKVTFGNRAFCVRSRETYLVAFDSVRPRYAGQSS